MKPGILTIVGFVSFSVSVISFQNCSSSSPAASAEMKSEVVLDTNLTAVPEFRVSYDQTSRKIVVKDLLGNELTRIPTEVNKAVSEGTRVYTRNGDSFLIYDLTVPSEPKIVGKQLVRVDAVTYNMDAKSGYVYIPHSYTGIDIYDARNASSIRTLPTLSLAENINQGPEDIVIQNHYAYVAACELLWVLDLANPAAPRAAKRINYGTAPLKCAAVIGIENDILKVMEDPYSLTNPADPQPL